MPYHAETPYVVLKNGYLNDFGVNIKGKKMLRVLDDMDPVDALHVIRDLEALLEAKVRG